MANSNLLYEEASALRTQLHKKQSELEKRKELSNKMIESDIVLQKQKMKEEKVEKQIDIIKSQVDSKVEYFRLEIRLGEEKMEKEIRDAKEKFEKYRQYCYGQIEGVEKKFGSQIELLEQSKEQLTLSVADDKIIKRLEIEIEQLKEKSENKMIQSEKEREAELKVKRQERMMEIMIEEEKLRNEEHRKREQQLQERELQKAMQERKDQERREKRDGEIQAIQVENNCSIEEARNIWSRPKVDSKTKERIDINKLAQQIRITYPAYKPIISELDIEYTTKMVKLEGDALLKFLETMKPLVQLKQEFENDDTQLNYEYTQLYDKLSIDNKITCIKLKTKEKRYKFLDKFKKTRVDEMNDGFGCV